MGDGIKKCFPVLKYGIFFAAFAAIFITELIILLRPEPKLNTQQYITEVAFPEYFRTLDEQKAYANAMSTMKLSSACCITNTTWLTPITMTDVTGVVRNMAQFRKKKQFFKSDTCTKRNKICPCKCAVERTIVSGIYVHNIAWIPTHQIGTFPSDGCCKCV